MRDNGPLRTTRRAQRSRGEQLWKMEPTLQWPYPRWLRGPSSRVAVGAFPSLLGDKIEGTPILASLVSNRSRPTSKSSYHLGAKSVVVTCCFGTEFTGLSNCQDGSQRQPENHISAKSRVDMMVALTNSSGDSIASC